MISTPGWNPVGASPRPERPRDGCLRKRCEHCNEPCRERSVDARRDSARIVPPSAPENRRAPENGLRYRTGRGKPKSASQGFDLFGEFEPKNLSQKTNLRFERVNEVTFKLTDGEVTNVPASHGQWGGYRTTKAVAWVIKIAPGAWLARCRDRGCLVLPLLVRQRLTHSRWRGALMAITRSKFNRASKRVSSCNWKIAKTMSRPQQPAAERLESNQE